MNDYRIKTWPRIDLTLLRLCRWKAEIRCIETILFKRTWSLYFSVDSSLFIQSIKQTDIHKSCVQTSGYLHRRISFFMRFRKIPKSKRGHESALYMSVYDDFGSTAEVASFSTTLKSSQTDTYKVDSWPCFDAIFLDF